jgi:hypothetical protein
MRYRPPGASKTRRRLELTPGTTSGFRIILVVIGCSSASKLLECCLANVVQRWIHLWGAIAACSSSTSLISGMGKLGRKKSVVEAYPTKSIDPNYTSLGSMLKDCTSLNRFIDSRIPKLNRQHIDNIPCAEPRYQMDEEMYRCLSVSLVQCSWA